MGYHTPRLNSFSKLVAAPEPLSLGVILSEAKNPIEFTHAVALLDSSPSLRMTNGGWN